MWSSVNTNAKPRPPYLIVSVGRSFGVLMSEIEDLTATVQAFDLGIFTNCYFYDRAGNSWPVVSADLTQSPHAKGRRDPSDLIPVSITVGPSVQRPLVDVINDLLDILISDNEFAVYLGESVSIRELRKKGDALSVARAIDRWYARRVGSTLNETEKIL